MHVLLRVQYSCGGVLVFWLWREMVFGVMYILSVQYSSSFYIIFQQIVLGSISFRLKSFFGAHFKYKLMYYYFYHRSDLCKIIQFLREIECIEFECNKFVLGLSQIDLLHFEHSICISST
jgi:hypothetical protein